MRRMALSVILAVLVLPALAGAQQQSGTVSGIVSDEQGAVLPGVTVTVSGPALMGGGRTAVTGETGSYQLSALPAGVYTVKFELANFSTLIREGIRVSVAVVTPLDVQLKVGGIQESVTVTGESPIVDVRSTISQTNIEKELYEAVPTGRNPWVMAGLVPGVITGRLDVGGTEGMQQYNLEAFGSADSQKSFSIDGLKTNWPGGSGGATMQYYDFGMYEEYNFQTASGTAESDVAGIYMNMVTKSGGNQFSSSNVLYFMNDALQGSNVDDDLRARLGLRAGQQTGAAGNPIDVSYDWNSTLGGPILKDRAWFFGSIRWWRLDQFQIGAVNPDGSQAIDDNRIRNFMGKVTYQSGTQGKYSFMFNRNLKDRFHRRDAPYLFVEDRATVLQDQPAQNFVFQYNRVLGQSGLFDLRFGRMWGTFPTRYQSEVQPTDIAIRDVVRFTRINAAETQSLNPNHRWQFNVSLNQYRDNFAGGPHDFKLGVQISREKMDYDRIRNGDLFLELRDGVPFQANLANTPVESQHRVNTWGAFVQDSWVIRQRLSLNLGVRLDGIHGFLPEQSSPAGTFVGARSFPKRDDIPDWPINVAPRLGFSYDLLGSGKTALKGYYGRFYNQIGSEMLEGTNPNALSTASVVWNDLNGDGRLALGPGGTFAGSPELGPFTGFVGGATTVFDSNSDRPYSDEFNIGVEHTLTTDFSVSVSYHRRHHRDGIGVIDRARPPSAYTPVQRSYTDPFAGAQTITVYNLDPALRAVRDRLITNVADLKSDYNGVVIEAVKRMSNRWQVLAGLTLQRHEGFFHDGTFTNDDFNNPNVRINRDGARVFTDVPWLFNLSGSYLLPYDVTFAAKYTARDGDPLRRRAVFTGLTQASETVDVAPRGTDRTDDVTQFVDIRVNKGFDLGRGTRLEGMVDVFNLLNANHVLLQSDVIGTIFARPTRILTPRIVRFGVRFSF
jgi:hypothetical protein